MLNEKFFERDTKKVAKELLGKVLVYGNCKGKIVETEAYYGTGDPGSHAFKGPTPRSKIMFGPPGYVYVYFTYGNHFMLNFITEENGKPGAVLIRAVEPLEGITAMKRRRKNDNLTNGPGKLTQAFGIDKKLNGTIGKVYIENSDEKPKIITTTRIGIKAGSDLPYRFYIKDNKFISIK